MQNLFDELNSLDQRCYSEFFLSEDILMEHAANGMATYIKEHFAKNSKIVVYVGGSNNGADGVALARLLHKEFDVFLYFVKEPKSPLAKLQVKRAKALGVKELSTVEPCDIVVDAIFGTGFSGELDELTSTLIDELNSLRAYKIACDVPSAFRFIADTTITMGALKKSMFLDSTKDVVGDIRVVDLGLSRDIYEKDSNWKLLDMGDFLPPIRVKNNSNKGSYGHLAVIGGQMSGAATISAKAALNFGCGLVSLLGVKSSDMEIINSKDLPKNTTAIAVGMGLGDMFSVDELKQMLTLDLPLVADADIFYKKEILEFILKKDGVVLTPHPKEFVSLLKLIGLVDIGIDELQSQRFRYVELFCEAYPKITLLLKGANIIIAKDKNYYINPHGKLNLAKGGSGDVLSGLIGSLLAQGYSGIDSAIHGSLALAKLSQDYKGANFSLTPKKLIKGIKCLTN